MKKLVSLFLSLSLLFALAACKSEGGDTTNNPSENAPAAATEIYFLNFKPEIASVYEKIAKEYKEKTGVTVKVVTAASNGYEQTLTSEIAKSNPPTIFQINGPVGYRSWSDYCADLKDTALYSFLSDKSLAIKEGDGVYGIPYVVEGYGIIYNEEITDKYFSLKDRKTAFSSMDEINSFSKLKDLVEDMQSKKSELGIEGVFASTSFSSGNSWRWDTHLANVPLYYEFSENKNFDDPTLAGLGTSDITFTYSDNFKNLFDLYINNSGTPKNLIGSKSVNDSMAEFALGKVAMVQNGNWAYKEISGVDGNVVKKDKIKMLPVYTGVKGEENQGLCIGTENYLAINSKVSKEKQKASADFLEWLFSSDEGKRYVTEELGFISPFNTFDKDERPEDPLANEILDWMEKKDIKSVPWIFTSFPSETFKQDFSNALLQYAQGSIDWEKVVSTVRTSWKSEFQAP
ncbi:MAG: ABC transporter substrate-binding protein [Clostridia bacterium]|nr:ABC transporter substrate-binding protein [Clostridia bacterium]